MLLKEFKGNILKLNYKELVPVLKKSLKEIINPDIYEITDVEIKGNGVIITIDYFYMPTEKAEVCKIQIVDLSNDLDKDNVLINFPID